MTDAPAALIAIAASAFAVESAIGFGATVITVALAANFIAIDALLPAFVPVNMLLSAYIAVRDRRHVDARTLLVRVLPPMVLGLPIGILALARLDERVLKIAFAAFVIGLSVVEVVRLSRAVPAPQPAEGAPHAVAGTRAALAADVALLVLGGAIHGAFGTGGPMAVYVAAKRLGEDRRVFRVTLAGLWLLLNVALLTTFAIRGRLDRASLETSALLLPALAVGTAIGAWAHPRIPQRAFRFGVFVMLAAAAVVLIVRSI
ncbi:MAG: sulfite exporter TauE/SafE family protein [Polyangiaceae bacterium]